MKVFEPRFLVRYLVLLILVQRFQTCSVSIVIRADKSVSFFAFSPTRLGPWLLYLSIEFFNPLILLFLRELIISVRESVGLCYQQIEYQIYLPLRNSDISGYFRPSDDFVTITVLLRQDNSTRVHHQQGYSHSCRNGYWRSTEKETVSSV